MTKADFSKVELAMIDGSKQIVDFQHTQDGLANQMFMQAREIKWYELALRIYHADGDVELSDEEVEYILNFIKPWSIVAQKGIEAAIK